jgi:predicted DsbA family dithiol-disulfide isomerase
VRLHHVLPEYAGRVRLRVRPFPLEVMGGEAAPRRILEQEWWLAALQEPLAEFKPFTGDVWPTTTLPAFEVAWCAAQQSDDALLRFDLRVRQAFFGESRNIGRREVLLELANETGLDVDRIKSALDDGTAREAVLAEARAGQEQYRVRGTPTLMLADGTKLRAPIAFARMHAERVVGVMPLPCHGEECLQATRELLERALASDSGRQ